MISRDTPLSRRLMAIILLISGVVSVLTCALLFANEILTFRRATARQLSTLGEIIAANSTAALAFDNREDASEILSALKAERHIVAAGLYDRRGNVFSTYPAGLGEGQLPHPPLVDGYRFESSHPVSIKPVMLGANRLGILYLRSDMTAMYERLRSYGMILLVAAAVSFAVAYLLSRVLQRQISQPILGLAETARAVTERGDFSVRAASAGGREMGLLTDAFNRMLGHIQELNTALEQRVTQRTAQLQAANAELEAFSYSVSHDLRAPLRHIDGFAGLLLKADGASVSERGRGYLAHIQDAAKQMGALIDDLLVFSRMGRSEMTLTPVDLGRLTAETVESLQVEVAGRNVRWNLAPLPVVQGDRPMLRQVLVNLLANAVKYSRPRDPAEIEVGCIETAEEFVVFVRDNGVGFEMEYAPKLFGVFQRLHRAEDFEGTGIGLANVRRIVTRHGGRAWGEGRPGKGATFSFSLPRTIPKKP